MNRIKCYGFVNKLFTHQFRYNWSNFHNINHIAAILLKKEFVNDPNLKTYSKEDQLAIYECLCNHNVDYLKFLPNEMISKSFFEKISHNNLHLILEAYKLYNKKLSRSTWIDIWIKAINNNEKIFKDLNELCIPENLRDEVLYELPIHKIFSPQVIRQLSNFIKENKLHKEDYIKILNQDLSLTEFVPKSILNQFNRNDFIELLQKNPLVASHIPTPLLFSIMKECPHYKYDFNNKNDLEKKVIGTFIKNNQMYFVQHMNNFVNYILYAEEFNFLFGDIKSLKYYNYIHCYLDVNAIKLLDDNLTLITILKSQNLEIHLDGKTYYIDKQKIAFDDKAEKETFKRWFLLFLIYFLFGVLFCKPTYY